MPVKDCSASDRMSETYMEMERSIYSKVPGWGGPEEGTLAGVCFHFQRQIPRYSVPRKRDIIVRSHALEVS